MCLQQVGIAIHLEWWDLKAKAYLIFVCLFAYLLLPWERSALNCIQDVVCEVIEVMNGYGHQKA